MKILGLEFSSRRRSVSVLHMAPDGAVKAHGSAAEEAERSTRAFALIQSALKDAGLERGEIDCIAVGLGPGSLTGIRMAISIAQGWQLARQVKVIGISSIGCIARQLQAQKKTGIASILIDTRRKDFVKADYQIDTDKITLLRPLELVTLAEMEESPDPATRLAGPELDQVIPRAFSIYPDAATLCRVACQKTDFVDASQLEPILLRPTEFVKAPPPRTSGA